MKLLRLAINLFLTCCSYFIKRKDNWIVFGSWMGENYIDNPRYIYEYLISVDNDYKLVWIGEESIRDMIVQNDNTLFVKKDSMKSLYYLLKSKYMFVSQSLEADLTSYIAYKGAVVVHCWHGVPVKKIGSHMEGSIVEHKGLKKIIWSIYKAIFDLPIKYTYFVSSSLKNDLVFQEAFNYIGATHNNILSSGYPRNDMFFEVKKYQINRLKQKYSESLGFSLDKKIILYLPTYRRKSETIETMCNRDEKEAKILNGVLDNHQALLLEKNHFATYKKIDSSLDNIYSNSVIKIYPDQEVNIQEVLLFTDILISDYSGAFLDFTLLDRPIIHYAYDYNYYKDVDSGLYYDIEEFAAGKVANTFDELVEELEQLLSGNDKYKNKREQVRQDFMTYEKGHACKYICDKVLK